MSVADTTRFGIADYVVFAIMLAISAAIGLYFACSGKKQKSTREFLMADRSMPVIPVAMSMFASFMSAISILGIPAEVYTYGTMYSWSILAYIPAVFLSSHLYIPVFYNLQLTSVYEYLELRFNRPTRMFGAFCYILQMVLYMSIVLYAPSLAVSAVTGMNTWVSVLSIGVVCTFYTALGGMKAVMWTDTLQALIMFMGMLAVLIQGFKTLGWSQVWQDAADSGRTDLFTKKAFDPNPLVRHTAWNLVIGGAIYWTGTYGTNQAQVQRALSVPSLKKAKIAYLLNLPGLLLIIACGIIAGLIIYSYFRMCDPIANGRLTASDQLYPLFVMEVLGHLHGLPGLIVAAVASGALSTISSGLNSLSAVVLTDLVQPLRAQPIPDSRAAIISKVIAASLGVVCILMTFVVSALGSVLQSATTLYGTCGGVILGVFTLGMFFPCANSKGAFTGMLVSLGVTLWIGLGAQFNKPYVYKYPISTDGCPLTNMTINTTDTILGNLSTPLPEPTTTLSVEELVAQSQTGFKAIYSLSYQWLATNALVICTLVGLVVSLITGGRSRESLNPKLITPLAKKFCCCMPYPVQRVLFCGVQFDDYEDEEEKNVELKVVNTLQEHEDEFDIKSA